MIRCETVIGYIKSVIEYFNPDKAFGKMFLPRVVYMKCYSEMAILCGYQKMTFQVLESTFKLFEYENFKIYSWM